MDQSDGQELGRLTAPARNEYFYGKLLDDAHLRMEQQYFIRKRWLLNRLTLGTGVVCGLVVRAKDRHLVVSPGVAIDAYGREIVVPEEVIVDPWIAFDRKGKRVELPTDAGSEVWLCLSYVECPTEAVPVLVADCDSTGGSRCSTIVEGYRLTIRTDAPPTLPRRPDDALCAALHRGPSQAERVQGVCDALMCRDCGPVASECVALVQVSLTDKGIEPLERCVGRPAVYGNDALFDMILCLAARVEECCGKTPTPTPVMSLAYVSGENQSATTGTLVAGPLVVEVRKDGVVLSNETVTFAVQAGGGTVGASAAGALGGSATIVTDAAGRASLPRWQLGPAATANAVRASIAAGSPLSFDFHALGTAPPPAHVPVVTLVYVAGDNQVAPAGQAVPAPLVVEVREDNVAMAGRAVSFDVTAGGGKLASTAGGVRSAQVSVTSGANGRASLPVWELGPGSATGANVVTASVAAAPAAQVPFHATGTAKPVLSLVYVSGQGQSALVNHKVPAPLVVEARSNGAPAPGESIIFSEKLGHGKVSDTVNGALVDHVTIVTGAAGRASLPVWQLGPAPGVNQVIAELGGTTPVLFDATSTPGDEPKPMTVRNVEFTDAARAVIARLSGLPLEVTLKVTDRPSRITFTFSSAPDPASLSTFQGGQPAPATYSVLIERLSGGDSKGPVAGRIEVDPSNPAIAIWRLPKSGQLFEKGEYRGRLFSAPNHASVQAPGAELLDGEPTQLPSGDGTPGGTFTFRFTVA